MTGQAPAAKSSFRIENIGGGNLTWQAAADVAWLKLSKPSGNGPATVDISLQNIGPLARGAHQGIVTVTAPNAQASPQTINVTLDLKSPPTLAIDGAAIFLNGVEGNTDTQPSSFLIRNQGDGVLNWAVNETIPWLEIAGNISGQGRTEVDVRANAGTLAVGHPPVQFA